MIEQLAQILTAAKTDEEREKFVLQARLKSLPHQVRDALRAAAIPHWFDLSFLEALLSTPLDACQIIYESLTQLSMVESCPGRGYNIHERSRFLLLEEIEKEDPGHFLELSQRAVLHCKIHAPHDAIWEIETIFHLLIAEPALGLVAFCQAAQRWDGSNGRSYDLLDALARVVREHREAGRLDKQACGWSFYWDGRLDQIYFRPEAQSHLMRARELAGQDLKLNAEVTLALGKFYPAKEAHSLYQEALGNFQQLDDKAGIASTHLKLGDLADQAAGLKSARPYYEKALAIYEQIGDRSGREETLRRLGRLKPIEPPDQLFISHFAMIESIAIMASQRRMLSKDETEDFHSYLKLKMIENNYELLRKYKGTSSFRTYLTVVIDRILRDYQGHLWGKWRPSEHASRNGHIAVEWEILRVRDGFTFDEAFQILQTRYEKIPSRGELEALEAQLPPRVSRRQELQDAPKKELTPEEILVQRESHTKLKRVLAALRGTLDKLLPEDRLLIDMYFSQGLRVSEIARTLRLEQKPLYRRIDRIIKEVRLRLEKQGFSPEQVELLIETREAERL